MKWNLISQWVTLAVSSALLTQFWHLRFQDSYRAQFRYVVFQFLNSLVLITFRYFDGPFDYRLIYCPFTFLSWVMTILMVYSTLTAILKTLPGILRFSRRLLNGIVLAWVAISLTTVMSGYLIYGVPHPVNFLTRLTAMIQVLDGRFLVAELAVVVSILIFVLRFPIRIPRNLAIFSVGMVAIILAQGILMMAFNFLPELRQEQDHHRSLMSSIPTFIMDLGFVYWTFALSSKGEEAAATFGRDWQTVPQEHLVRQLEAMNAALLRSREKPYVVDSKWINRGKSGQL